MHFKLEMVFKKKDLTTLVGNLTYPKQSNDNYPYNIIVRDKFFKSQDDPEEYEHRLTVVVKNSGKNRASKKYNLFFDGDIPYAQDIDLSNLIAKDIRDYLMNQAAFEGGIYSVKLNKNKIKVSKNKS